MAKKQFKAESKRLLELMINSIYTNKEIFLRELISNASDALDKRHYLSLTDHDHKVAKKDLTITIIRDQQNRQLTIEDTGIGMTAEEMEKNLGTIARSGSAEFVSQLEKASKNIDIIGQFGVGFYSAFMVAKKITVESRSALSDKGFCWVSSGQDGYTISEIEKDTIGTRIILDLKDDTDDEKYSDFLQEYKIRDLVKKYSDYVRYPINMEVTKSVPDPTDENATIDTKETETLNSMIPLWKKNKSKITDEEYNEFYKTKFSDWEDPAKVIHYNIEGNISYTALMYIPSKAPSDFWYQTYESGLQLYTKGVFIMDKAKDLLPEHFRFVRGLIDSDDLNLNISREILQQDRQVRALAKSVEKKIQNALEDMLKNEREKYEKFFDEFGLNLKYGIYKDFGMHKEQLQDLLLFRTESEGKYVTLKEYTENMKDDQKVIYYACGKSLDDIHNLPALEKIRDKGYEVLCFLHDIDEFCIQMMRDYDGKQFQSITTADLDLDSDEEKKAKEEKTEENKDMLGAMKEALGDLVKEVRISSRLKDDPVCIVAAEGPSLDMERYMANDPNNILGNIKANKILEINPDHAIFGKLQEVYREHPEELSDYADVLFQQALLIQGLPIEDPVAYTKKITEMMIRTK